MWLSLLISLVLLDKCQAGYVALAPTEFHPGWKYMVQVSVSGATASTTVLARLRSKEPGGQSFMQTVDIPNGESRLLEIDVSPNTVSGQYVLELVGTGGLSFSNSTDISYNPIRRLTFIQTDKTIYKAGQMVQFRVLSVDKDLKPEMLTYDVELSNPKGSKLAIFKSGVPKYVFEGTYSFAEFPDLGQWTLTAKTATNEVLQSLTFKVDEYVPPKAEVTVAVTPGYIISGSGNTDVMLDMTAKYTYGKGLMGDYVITIEGSGATHTGKITDPSGLKSVNLPLASAVQRFGSGNIPIKVAVTDETGRTYEASTSVRIESQPVKIEVDEARSQLVYRTGMGLHIVAKIADPDGSPLGPALLQKYKEVSLSLTDDSVTANSQNVRYTLQPNQVEVVWHIPSVNSTRDSLTLQVDLIGSSYSFQTSVHKFLTVGTKALRIQGTTDTLTVGQMMKFSVETSSANDFSSIFYVVVSRGNIQVAGRVTPGQETTVKVSTAMCPKGRLLVYGLTSVAAGSKDMPEIIADTLALKLSHCQDKKVSPTVANAPTRELRTGTNASVSVAVSWTDATRNDPVGQHDVYLLGVDKSIILLEGDNDIKPARVEKDLEQFNLPESQNYNQQFPMARARRSIMPWQPAVSPSTGQLLQACGVEIMSDSAVLHPVPLRPMLRMKAAYSGRQMSKVLFKNADAADGAPEMEKEVIQTGAGAGQEPVRTVRKDFPETWIFEHVTTDDMGLKTVTRTLPDSITSWVISGFAIRQDSPMAVTAMSYELKAFNPFFVTLNLPYSIRRMEEFELRATVFNYRDTDKMVKVTLTPSADFQIRGSNSFDIMVRQGQAASQVFMIVANKVGTISLVVQADSAPDSDTIDRKLIVKPEGVERMRAITFPVILTQQQPQFEQDVQLDFSPWTLADVVTDSRRAMVTITGDMMGNALQNIDSLLSVPYGCGEQNMISTVPNIVALKYLKAINDVPVGFEDKARNNMKQGYQKETGMYRWSNGGYSAFGEQSDESASTWLTAFVLRSFTEAKQFIGNDFAEYGEMLTTAAAFLFTKRQANGAFREDGRVIHTEMTGGSSSGDALSVYVTICLLEARAANVLTTAQQLQLQESLRYIKDDVYFKVQSQPQSNLYLGALLAYAFALEPSLVSNGATNILSKLDVDGVAPWRKQDAATTPSPVIEPFYSYQPPSAPKDIEITAYCLLAYYKLANLGQGRELVLWMQKQQNSNGGYRSTQDTVMALQAISAFAASFRDGNPSSTVRVRSLDPADEEKSYTINIGNSVLLTYIELPDETNKVKIRVTGNINSLAVVKVVWYFYTAAEAVEKPLVGGAAPKTITLSTTTKKVREGVHEVKACFKPGASFTDTKMMMLGHLEKPSGTNLVDIQQTRIDNAIAARVEEKDGVVDYYFNEMSDGCVTMQLEETVPVKNRQPGNFIMSAYYDPDTKTEVKVEILDSTVKCQGNTCVTCTDGDCNATTNTHASLTNMLLTACVCLLLSLLLAIGI